MDSISISPSKCLNTCSHFAIVSNKIVGGNNCSWHHNRWVCWLPNFCFLCLCNRNWLYTFKHLTNHTLWNCEQTHISLHYCWFSSSISSPPLLSSLPLFLPFRLSSKCLCPNSWFSSQHSFSHLLLPSSPDCFSTFHSECQHAGVCSEWGGFLRTMILEAYVLESLWNPPWPQRF